MKFAGRDNSSGRCTPPRLPSRIAGEVRVVASLGHDKLQRIAELMAHAPSLTDSELGRALRRLCCGPETIQWGELEQRLARAIRAQQRRRKPK